MSKHMKDTIQLVIQAQSKEEFKSFKRFIGVSGANTKTLQLALQLRNDSQSVKINSNAYRLTKKRLKLLLESFALIYNKTSDPRSEVTSKLEMAKYLSAKNLHLQAWEYLYKAETIAKAHEEYELLNLIYYTQISYYANRYLPDDKRPDIKKVLNNLEKNSLLSAQNLNGNSAFALLTYELTQQLSTGFTNVNEMLVNKILSRFNLNEHIYSSPKIYSRLVNIVCWAMVERKEYDNLKAYAMDSYKQMVANKMINKVPSDFLMEFLSILCLSLFRTRDFKLFAKYQLIYAQKVELFKNQKDKFVTYDFRGRIMKADLHCLTGNFTQSQNEFIELDRIYGDVKDNLVIYFILRVNLMSMNFIDKQYHKCIKLFHELTSFNIPKKIIGKAGLGLEIVLFTEIYAAIFYYELEEFEDAMRQLKNLKRRYATTLNEKTNRREAEFIRILENLINKTGYANSITFKNDCLRFRKMKEYIPGDREYISFTAWLMSKLSKRGYYTELKTLVNE